MEFAGTPPAAFVIDAAILRAFVAPVLAFLHLFAAVRFVPILEFADFSVETPLSVPAAAWRLTGFAVLDFDLPVIEPALQPAEKAAAVEPGMLSFFDIHSQVKYFATPAADQYPAAV